MSRSTWIDWLDRPVPVKSLRLLTRDEVLEEVGRSGIAVTERELRYWEACGALPHPARRFRDGATRTCYPPFHGQIVAQARRLHSEGHAYRDMAMPMRAYFREVARQYVQSSLWHCRCEALLGTLKDGGLHVHHRGAIYYPTHVAMQCPRCEALAVFRFPSTYLTNHP